MTTLYFTKLLTTGTLKGIAVNEKMTFVSAQAACEWVRRIKASKRASFTIIDHSFQSYFR